MKESVDPGVMQDLVAHNKVAPVLPQYHAGELMRNLLDDKMESFVNYSEKNCLVKTRTRIDQRGMKEGE